MKRNKKQKPRHELRLVNWVNDNCPPIDLNTRAGDVVKLVRHCEQLEKQLKTKERLIAINNSGQ